MWDSRQTDLAVPEPVPTRDGELTVQSGRICSLLRWMDGRRHASSARPGHLRLLGAAMARLRNQADTWSPPADFVRIRWDWETFFGETMEYGGVNAAKVWELLPADLRRDFEHDDYARLRSALLDGYTTHRPVESPATLDTFIAVREVAFGLWFAGTAQANPVFHDRLGHEFAAIRRRLATLSAG
ncbi:hypothetical protein [Kutzneria sp. NPDC052558]|uniref:hypothetical protein n=1 Tax=Kutzneria sp. NPDC052558 TaxID=3364121 RepID=UPI0037CC00FE